MIRKSMGYAGGGRMRDKKSGMLGICLLACSIVCAGCGAEKAEVDSGVKEQTVVTVEQTEIPPSDEPDTAAGVSVYEFDFQGLTVNEQAPRGGNIPVNLKTDIPGLVCPGDDAAYYVNCGRDNYLYQLKGEESSLILSEVVSSLNYWEGELYFVLHEDGDIRSMGKVCKYNVQTGEIETIMDVDALYCYVTETGIYYTEGNKIIYDWGYAIQEDLKYYSFEDGGVTDYSGNRWNQYGSYCAQPLVSENTLAGIGFKSRNTDEIIPFVQESNESFLIDWGICNGMFYGIGNNRDEFAWMDLRDGSGGKVSLSGTDTASYFYDYIPWNDNLYVSLGTGTGIEGQMAVVDLQNTAMRKMIVQTEQKTYSMEEIEQGNFAENTLYSYQELYTDGSKLFVLKHFTNNESLEDGLLLVQLVPYEKGFCEVELGAQSYEK